jgi:hypothetical protein
MQRLPATAAAAAPDMLAAALTVLPVWPLIVGQKKEPLFLMSITSRPSE